MTQLLTELGVEAKSIIIGLIVLVGMRLANASLPKGYHFKIMDKYLAENKFRTDEDEDKEDAETKKGAP